MKYFEQETGYTCGVAALRMVWSHFHDVVPDEATLAAQLNTNDKIGTSPEMIVDLAQRNSFEVLSGQNGTVEKLDELTKAGYVVMLAISVDVPHWVVYLENNGNHVFFHDPFFGEKLSREMRKFFSEKQKYPFYRWRVNAEEFKKYLPDMWEGFKEVESNKLWLAFKIN